jgi:hypothetical protein
MFLHIMVKYNPKNRINLKKCISWWIGIYFYENNTCNCVLKHTNIIQKNIEMI